MSTTIPDRHTELLEAVEALMASDWASTCCDETRAEIARFKPQTDVHRDRIRSVSFTVDDTNSAFAALEYRFGPAREITTFHRRVNVWHHGGREVRLQTNSKGDCVVIVD